MNTIKSDNQAPIKASTVIHTDDPGAEDSRGIPKILGVIFFGAGFVGFVAPGPFGIPLMIIGGMIIWPRAFRGPDRWLRRKMPTARKHVEDFTDRFVEDMDRRYPRA